jgi:hypothetical protein
MRPSIPAIVVISLMLGACSGTTEYRTVTVMTPNGPYQENVGVTPTQPAPRAAGTTAGGSPGSPAETPAPAPTYVRKPVTIYPPNAPPTTVDISVPQ